MNSTPFEHLKYELAVTRTTIVFIMVEAIVSLCKWITHQTIKLWKGQGDKIGHATASKFLNSILDSRWKVKSKNVIYDFFWVKIFSSLTQKKHRVKGCTDSFRLKCVLLYMMYSDIGKNGPLFCRCLLCKKVLKKRKDRESRDINRQFNFCTDYIHAIANNLQVERITIQAFKKARRQMCTHSRQLCPRTVSMQAVFLAVSIERFACPKD